MFLPMDRDDTSSVTPNEAVFIRKFSSQQKNEPQLNSTILRREEMEVFSKRFSSHNTKTNRIKDFNSLCRGQRLVIDANIFIT